MVSGRRRAAQFVAMACFCMLGTRPSIQAKEIGSEVLESLVKSAKSAQARLDVDANIDLKKIECKQLGATGRVCIGQFVPGIGINILARDDKPILLQLVVSTKNVKNRKDIGRAINAFMIFTSAEITQQRLDALVLVATSCVVRSSADETSIGPFTFESTGSGCVVGYDLTIK